MAEADSFITPSKAMIWANEKIGQSYMGGILYPPLLKIYFKQPKIHIQE